jgi:simple sugar transport system ATP-binding protein
VGFVPEDRLRDAVIPEMTLAENLALAEAGTRRGLINWSAYRERTRQVIARHDVRTFGIESAAGSLSGGNQQKFVLGRELEGTEGAPQALIAENPTRGLDIRAAATVREQLREARNRGMAIVLYSSDLDELLEIADRMVVCFAGQVTAVAKTPDAVARAMAGLP